MHFDVFISWCVTWIISHVLPSSEERLPERGHCHHRVLIRWLFRRRHDGVTCAYVDVVDVAQVVPFVVVAMEMDGVGSDVGGVAMVICGAARQVAGRVVDQVVMVVDDSLWW